MTSPRDGPIDTLARVQVCLPSEVTAATCAWITLEQEMLGSTFFETGFEPSEGYTVGLINGQSSWSASATGALSAHPSISDDNPSTGVQHARCASDPAFAAEQWFDLSRPFDPAGPGPCTISFDVNISQTGGAWYAIAGYDRDGPMADWQIDFDPEDPGGDGVPGDIFIWSASPYVNTMAEYEPGVYRNLRIELDDGLGSLKLFYGGVMIHDGAYFGGPTKLIVGFYPNDSGSMMDIDNFVLSCQGDPILGACCMPDSSCVPDRSRAECREQSGISWRAEFACDVTTCDGACCLTSRACVENMTVTECEAANGEFRGVAAPCLPGRCAGACCLGDATCWEDLRESDCEDLDGLFQGRGTECTADMCCPDDPDQDQVTGCDDVCPYLGGPGGVDGEGRPLGDLDHNCSVDLADYAVMLLNYTGPAVP